MTYKRLGDDLYLIYVIRADCVHFLLDDANIIKHCHAAAEQYFSSKCLDNSFSVITDY